MNLPDAKATLTPKVAASDYVFFQRDLTDPAGMRRSADQPTGVFTRDWQGKLFMTGMLYCFCASSPTVGDDAQLGFFNAAGVPVSYTGQDIVNPGAITVTEQQIIAPAGTALPNRLRYGRAMVLVATLRDFSDDFSDDFD